MSFEALVLGLFSGLRPGTSLAAVLVLLKAPEPRRPLLFFTVAGFAFSWVIGVLVVAAGLQQGWVQPRAHRSQSSSGAGTSSRFRRLRDPSPRVAALAGIGTH